MKTTQLKATTAGASRLLMLGGVLFVQTVHGYDDGIKPCWNVRLNNQDAFCYEAIKYPLSTPVFYDSDARDEEAKRMYLVLKDKWDKGGKGSPSNHCLAIARDMYCFTQFPRCQDNKNQEMNLCEHTCATWLERCPFEKQDLCDKMSDSDSCTGAISLLLNSGGHALLSAATAVIALNFLL